jgi:superfamily II DNA or RNA helicase
MLAQATGKGMRAWFLVHRVELLEQSVDTFVEAADIHTGVIAAGFPSTPIAPVQVCSIGSLARRLEQYAPPDLVVFDECHHIASESWSKLAAALPGAFHIGLTATPQRLDRQGLKRYFDELVIGPTTAELIAAGHLCPYVLYAPTADGPTLDGVKTTAGDFNKSQLAKVMDGSTIVGDAVESYVTACTPATRALVFVWSIDASKKLAQRFRDDGIVAEHLDGDTPAGDRKRIMAAFRAGDVKVICNVDLFGEGLDVPGVDAVFLLRPTQSLSLYLQQVGRGLRMSPGKESVKIFDHAGNWARHGLPDAPRVWSLEDTPKKKKKEPSGRRCLKCHAVSPPGASTCVACGEEFFKKPRQVKQARGVLEEWRAMSHAAAPVETGLGVAEAALRKPERSRTLREWRAIARQRGFKPGWAYYRFRDEQMKVFTKREQV